MFNSVSKFIKKISKCKSKYFSDELLRNLDMFLNNKKTKISFDKNKLVVSVNGDELRINLENHGTITFQLNKDDAIIKGKYSLCKNGYYVKTEKEDINIYDVDDILKKDIVHNELFKVYTRDGLEQFRRTTEKVDNYYEDKKTGEVTLCEPDIMENYTSNTYMWRVDGKYVLERKIKKYVYPDGTKSFIDIHNEDHCLIRYGLIKKDTKELPDFGEFYGVDNDVFLNYFQKKSTINDIVNNFHSKKYVRSHVIEF